MSDEPLGTTPWRVGRKVGRTLYDRQNRLVGVADTPDIASLIVEAVNGFWGNGVEPPIVAAAIPEATPPDEGPVTQASPDTRQRVAEMTAKWPVGGEATPTGAPACGTCLGVKRWFDEMSSTYVPCLSCGKVNPIRGGTCGTPKGGER